MVTEVRLPKIMMDSRRKKPTDDPDILHHLFEAYYQSGVSSPDDEFVSKHWMEERRLLKAVKDGNNSPIPSSEFNWGCKWTSLSKRILDLCETLAHLMILPNKFKLVRISATARRVTNRMGLDLTFTVFRQVCSLELILQHLPDYLREKRVNILVIGDGAGVISALLKAEFPDSTIALVDIGKTLFYQSYHMQKAYPNLRHKMSGDAANPEDADFAFCATERLNDLNDYRFDLAINIASMQEMSPATIERYFRFLRTNLNKTNLFYCFNRERKSLGDGVETEFLDYPWDEGDEYLVDEYCPWPVFFIGRLATPNRPRLLGVGIPFIKYYDGKFRHRLAVMNTNT